MWKWYPIVIGFIFLLPRGQGLADEDLLLNSQDQRSCLHKTNRCDRTKVRSPIHQPFPPFAFIRPGPATLSPPNGYWCPPGQICPPFHPYLLPTPSGGGGGNGGGNGGGVNGGGGSGGGGNGGGGTGGTGGGGNSGGGNGGGGNGGGVTGGGGGGNGGGGTSGGGKGGGKATTQKHGKDNAMCKPFEQHVLLPTGKVELQKHLNCTYANQTSVIIPCSQFENNTSAATPQGGKKNISINGKPNVLIIQDVDVKLGVKKHKGK